MKKAKVIILGGGLTGLTTAYKLAKLNIDFVLLEKSDRVGGVIKTVHENGFMYETGPNTGIIGSPELAELIEDLHEDLDLQIGEKAVKRRLILKNGKWAALPSGPISAVSTPLFRLTDKFRILGEPFRKKGTDPNETLAQLVKRRMGKSFLSYAIDPFILGVYAGDPSLLVTRTAFPKLYALEQNYGSFIGGTLKKKKEGKSAREAKATRDVFSFNGGLEQLTRSLEKHAGKYRIWTSIEDAIITKQEGKYQIDASQNGKAVHFESDILISCLNAPHLENSMFQFLEAGSLDPIKAVSYAPTVEVVLGFNKWNGRKLDAFGGLIPHCEGRQLLGVLFLSAFLPERAPEGGALLTIFMGGVRNPKWIKASDEEIIKQVKEEILDLMDLKTFDPDLLKIFRHNGAIPQYSFESDKKMARISQLEKQHSNFIIGGNILDGIGIADRVKQGYHLADRAANLLELK